MPASPDHPDWQQIRECKRVLHKAGSNPVREILRQSPPFQQWDHYPKGDVFDRETQSQYFYHAHPRSVDKALANHESSEWQENGHFHLFIRKKGIPAHIQPIKVSTHQQPKGSKEYELCHLIAISMDKFGEPICLFTTNRWVTGESWYQAEDVISLIDYFNIDHSYPSWPLNLWLSSMVRVYRDEIVDLILKRDQAIKDWQINNVDKNVFEDRRLEVTSSLHL